MSKQTVQKCRREGREVPHRTDDPCINSREDGADAAGAAQAPDSRDNVSNAEPYLFSLVFPRKIQRRSQTRSGARCIDKTRCTDRCCSM